MRASERILEELVNLAATNKIGLFEAAADYCDMHDLEQTDFISSLDPFVIERLKADAVSTRKVRRCVQRPSSTLI